MYVVQTDHSQASFATFDEAIQHARDLKSFRVTRVDPGESVPPIPFFYDPIVFDTPMVPYEAKGRLIKHHYGGLDKPSPDVPSKTGLVPDQVSSLTGPLDFALKGRSDELSKVVPAVAPHELFDSPFRVTDYADSMRLQAERMKQHAAEAAKTAMVLSFDTPESYAYVAGFQGITPEQIERDPKRPWVMRKGDQLLYFESRQDAQKAGSGPLMHISYLENAKLAVF